jgi:hypothetical protein
MHNRSQSHRTADVRYSDKRDVKRVSFNTTKAEDLERLRKLKQIPDFSNWVKSKIDELPSQ